MMTSSRPSDVGGSFANRRGHLSITDPNHHITEAIGTLYGDDDDYQGDQQRPLSFISSPLGGEQISPSSEEHRLRHVRTTSEKSDESSPTPTSANGNRRKSGQLGRMPSQRSGSIDGGPVSPISPTLRDMRKEEGSQFPMGNIENPNDIAQELSNLQALRRMSMDVSNNQDPDLLPYQNMSLMEMPSIAPQGDDDEGDPSRLLWVPAGVHPELAPSEFKSFLEKRVQTIKRRSGEPSLSANGLDRSNSGLMRKKSMLSRQVDNSGGRGADGYVDGAERLERQNSTGTSELSLDELVKDPTKAVQKLTLDTSAESTADDMPILPVAPGMGLRRSTRTTYRKGGSLKDRHGGSVRGGDRVPFSKRIAARKVSEENGSGSPLSESPITPVEAPPGHGLNRVQSEPVTENFSRPKKSSRRQPGSAGSVEEPSSDLGQRQDSQRQLGDDRPHGVIPQAAEHSAPTEEGEPQNRPYPARSSSQQRMNTQATEPSEIPDEPPARSSRRPAYGKPLQPQDQSQQQPESASQSSQNAQGHSHSRGKSSKSGKNTEQQTPSPGSGASRTDSLTFIPTFTGDEKKPDEKKSIEKKSDERKSDERRSDEKKSERKSKKEKSESDGKSSSWKWFKSDDKEKKKKDDENRKSKSKGLAEKSHDNVRLDVLQTSIDNEKGRKSLLLDRDSLDPRLEEERKKEANRKSSEPKKEKDGIFANFFGVSKKKSEKEVGSKKAHQVQRSLSPEPPPYRPLRPDVDYHWTRFPILEERAIYRMAHIKLANPRRALQSQVLLSNFMYAYLAKVQAMHPQIQVPQSPQQRRLQEEERRRRQQEQLEQQQYMEQQQAQDNMDQYNFEYHRSVNQYGDSGSQSEGGDYPESEEYNYGHKEQNDNNGYGNDGRNDDEDDDMW